MLRETMGKIEDKKEQKRLAILDAAKENFLLEGYVRASMDRIAKEAKVTKQTVYRYFPSKVDLFKATLIHMGKDFDDSFTRELEKPDKEEALIGFATAFIRTHLSEGHLKTYRLLIAESGSAPEIVQAFFSVGTNETMAMLKDFFVSRLDVKDPDAAIQLWTAMLLAFREDALMTGQKPDEATIQAHARMATHFLLKGLA